ncbi:MAG TPA: hypothetical protein VFV38_00225 [Ktedonobacteraceae bacterium]|nr:hypothetical protein [Ktedonobacteraceae bacterium]
MKPEEYLDYLIEQRKNIPGPPLLLDDEVASSLEAAKLLARMRKIPVPSSFALRLEGEVRTHARIQHSSGRSSKLTSSARIQRLHPSPPSPRRSLRIFAIGLAAVLLVAFGSLLTISVQVLPGDPFAKVTPTLANNAQNHANEALRQLENALVHLNTVVNGSSDDTTIKQAFEMVVASTQNSQSTVAALSTDPRFQTTRQRLAERLTEEKHILSNLLNQVNWSIKVVFTQQLSILGEAVPTITYVTVQMLSSDVLRITLSGSNFAFQCQSVIDGKRIGSVSQITANRLVAIVTNIRWEPGTHTIGVLNPAGTAAQIVYHSSNDRYEPPGTPTATPTESTHDD